MKWVFIKSGMLIMVPSMVSNVAYGLLFFNGATSTIDLHARIDSSERNDALGMRAVLHPKTSVIWQAPPAKELQVTIALSHNHDTAVVKDHKKTTVQAKASPAVPSFPPWQKTQTFTFHSAQFSSSKNLPPASSIIMQNVSNGSFKVAVISDSVVRLAGTRLYAQRLVKSKKGNHRL